MTDFVRDDHPQVKLPRSYCLANLGIHERSHVDRDDSREDEPLLVVNELGDTHLVAHVVPVQVLDCDKDCFIDVLGAAVIAVRFAAVTLVPSGVDKLDSVVAHETVPCVELFDDSGNEQVMVDALG